jgi:hypothetical protein
MVHISTYLKNAMRDIDRSSMADLDEAKMARSTAGVTGNLPFGAGGTGILAYVLLLAVDDEVIEAGIL